MNNIKARMITLREYQKYKKSNQHSLAYVNYLINTHYVDNKDIVVYDDINNKYLVVNERGIISDMKKNDFELTSYLVLDRTQIIDRLSTKLSSFRYTFAFDDSIREKMNVKIPNEEWLFLGEVLVPENRFYKIDNCKSEKIRNKFNISMNIDFGTYFYSTDRGDILNFSSMSTLFNEIIYSERNFSEIRRSRGRKTGEIVNWTFDNLLWTLYEDEDILISEKTYSDNLIFPLFGKEALNIISDFSSSGLKYENNIRNRKTNEDEKLQLNKIFEDAKNMVEEKNIYLDKELDSLVTNLFNGEKFKDGEYHILPLSSKQVNITSEDRFYYEVRLDALDLTINVEPKWYLKLKEKCRDEHPLNVNLVIELKGNEIHNDIIDLVNTSKLLNRWRLPENCCIVLKSSSKVSIEKHSAKKSTIFKYANDEYSTNNLNGGTEFISVTQVTLAKVNSTNTIIDNFDVTSEKYLTLEFGNECEKIRNMNDIYINVPEEFYEELVLIPKRERVLQKIKP